MTTLVPYSFQRIAESGIPNISGVFCVEAQFIVRSVGLDTMAHFGIDVPHNFSGMVNKRRSEYLAGRLCAREALLAAGAGQPIQIASAGDRSPIWPHGWTGSITHCAGRALAAVARADRGRRLGVDVEDLMCENSASRLAETILHDGDQLYPGYPFATALTIAFSAKEALYKGLYPDVQRFFGFEAASIVEYKEDVLYLELNEDLCGRWRRGSVLPVHCTLENERVYALMSVGAELFPR
ncbi:MAG: 4'-phosphopantetheinyl transferase superfamily protein [Halioglobus sp.]|nr:4'-phosphopantetheinyl transferase superfamily protein [Halioglobus sp.]